MTRRQLALGLLLGLIPTAGAAQVFTPQSPLGLSLSFTTERAGGTRVLIFGEVRNTNTSPAQHVVLVAEGLDQDGHTVSRARGYILGMVPSRGTAPFEIRISAAGSEKRYRVQIESFEFGGNGGN
jgi:hypothetical protein